MTRNGRVIALTAMAVLVPSLIQTALMLAFHGSSTAISRWINQYGLLVLLAEVAIGSALLFRAFSLPYALLLLIPYVPLTVALIQGVGLFVAGVVFNDYL